MAFTDNFGHPKGLVGRLMLVMMEKEHYPMARWALEQLELPQAGEIADIGCGGGYNMQRMLERSGTARVYGIDISAESVRRQKRSTNPNWANAAKFSGEVQKICRSRTDSSTW